MTEANAALPKLIELKKANFLALVPETPTSRGEMVDLLKDYQFIDTYLSFLIEHFVDNGKMAKDGDKFYRKGKKSSGGGNPREVFMAYRNADSENGMMITKRHLKPGEEMDKKGGEALTAPKAAKNLTSIVFAEYMSASNLIKALGADIADGKVEPADETQAPGYVAEPCQADDTDAVVNGELSDDGEVEPTEAELNDNEAEPTEGHEDGDLYDDSGDNTALEDEQ